MFQGRRLPLLGDSQNSKRHRFPLALLLLLLFNFLIN